MQEDSIFYLNAHLFRGTLVAAIYRKLQYNDEIRCKQICEYILQSNHTIIILSEVWSKYMRNKIINNLHASYPYNWVPKRHGPFYKVGPEHIILSKKPIANCCSKNIDDLSGWDKMSIKQICGFVVDNNFICTSHFDTGNMLKNAEQLKNFIQTYSNGRNVILIGDFNIGEISKNDPSLQTFNYYQMCNIYSKVNLQDAIRKLYPNFMFQPFYTVDQENNNVANYFSNGGTNMTHIDYVFVRGINPQKVNIEEAQLSDHYGIMMFY